MRAALQGAKEIGFTVLSMSTSLSSRVYSHPMMGGIVGRLFREFAVTLPLRFHFVGCFADYNAHALRVATWRSQKPDHNNRIYRVSERVF